MDLAVDISQIIATICAALGLLFAGFQMLQANKQQKISRVDEARKEFYSNPSIVDLYYKIEYDQFEYTDKFHESEDEKTLDNLLGIYDSLAKQVEMGLLNKNDLGLISYEYRLVHSHSEIAKYFDFLDDWYYKNNLPGKAFSSFRRIGKELS